MTKRRRRAREAPQDQEPQTILLVDDRDDCRITTKWFLNVFGYAVDPAHNAEEALALFNPKIHRLVITDNAMPGMSGPEMAQVLKLRSPSTPVVMYSGQPPLERACFDAVLQRPTHLIALKEIVDNLLRDRSPESAGARLSSAPG